MANSDWGSKLLLAVVALWLLVRALCSPAAAQPLFSESWDRTAPGKYIPHTIIFGDTGLWRLQDTFSEFPDCGPTPQFAEVSLAGGNKSVTLTSVKTDSGCADNIWIEPTALEVRPVQFGAGLFLSFTETGQIVEPASCDAVYITMLFDARVMEYVLQRGTWWTNPPPRTRCTDAVIDFPGPVILLGEHDGTYCRDLRSDLLSVGLPVPQTVTAFVFEITSGGSATIDDIKFFESDGAPTCAATSTPTATPSLTPTQTATARSGPGPLPCVGDCNGDGQVTIDEILTMVNIALDDAPISDCLAGDSDTDGQIKIDEILTAVNNALDECPGGNTP